MLRTFTQPNTVSNANFSKTIKWNSPAVQQILSQDTISLLKQRRNNGELLDAPDEIIIMEMHNFLERFPLPVNKLSAEQYNSILETIAEMIRKTQRGKVMLRQHYESQQTHKMHTDLPWRKSSWRPALHATTPHYNSVFMRESPTTLPKNLFDNHPVIEQDNFHSGMRGLTSSTRSSLTGQLLQPQSKARPVLPFRP